MRRYNPEERKRKPDDLGKAGVWDRYAELRNKLYKADERKDCVIIQGAAFVVNGRAFPIIGVGGIDFLDSLADKPEVDGIIGNGNALFVRRDFGAIYSTQTSEELRRCYEYEVDESRVDKFLDEAPMGPLVFDLRSISVKDDEGEVDEVRTREEYERIKQIKQPIVFEAGEEWNLTFSAQPVSFNSRRWKNELRGKFLGTTRVVHCARRETLEAKECLFDSREDIKATIDNFRGDFALVYTIWSQKLCDLMGMKRTRAAAPPGFRNPTDRITPYLFAMAKGSLLT